MCRPARAEWQTPRCSANRVCRDKKHTKGLTVVGGPAGTPIFENEEEEDYVQLIYSVAEKNGGIRKTTKGDTHTHAHACAHVLKTVLNKLLVLPLPSADEGL